MVAFITTGTFSSGTATNFYDTSFTAGLAGLRGSSLYFLGAGNTTLTAEDVGILGQALIYDLSFADPDLNPIGTQRFDVTSRFEMGEGNDFLDLTPRSSPGAAPEYTVDVTVLGGLGDDILWGGAGVNRLKGGLGNDTMVGGNRHDILGGGGQNDQIDGLGGNDTITGGEDQDVLHGGRGNDRLDGGSGDDQLFGEADDDVLAGGGGNDLLDGGSGDDDLAGGVGADRITGGTGDDTLAGRATGKGSGDGARDEFVYAAADNGTDWIRAFEHGIDKIDVSALSLSNAAQQELWLSTHVTTIESGRYGIDLSVGINDYGNIEIEVRRNEALMQSDFLF